MTTTFSGAFLLPNNYGVPSPTDMAVQLGRIPRFAGATGPWWSVLHHIRLCVLLWRDSAHDLLPLQSKEVELLILLHEADECATGDVPTLWKSDSMRKDAAKLQARTFRAYLGRDPNERALEHVKIIDELALRIEAEQVGPSGVLVHSGLARAYRPEEVARGHQHIGSILGEYDGPLSSAVVGSPLGGWFMDALLCLAQITHADLIRMEGHVRTT